MLEPPNVQAEQIASCLRDQFGLSIAGVEFLPLGADANTAVYRVTTVDQTPYFLKLRSGVFDKLSVTLPCFLHDQGIPQIIAPLTTLSGQLWGNLDAFKTLLYPFVEGQNGWDMRPTDSQWVEFGAALKRLHTVSAPAALLNQIQRETYSSQWREIVKEFQSRVEDETFADPISVGLADLFNTQRSVIDAVVERAERLGLLLQRSPPPETVICHADIHMGNLLLSPGGELYIVDWDTVILAPKERDLMFIGGGVGRLESAQEIALFYEGYGETQIDPVALAYYRYERIVQDIAAYCQQIFESDEGDLDRAAGLRQLSSQFLPNEVIDIAFRSDRSHIS